MEPLRGLVLVRAGQGHRFAPLMRVPRAARTWDLAVSWYDASARPSGAAVEWEHRHPGGKWDGIWHFFDAHPEALGRYDLFWLVDDDIEAEIATVEGLFDYARRLGLQLAQPALTHDSYFSHRLTLACPGFVHRHTNLVEIMAPVVSRGVLQAALPLFRSTRSGFGLDWYWHRLVDDPARQIAIIDALPVRHARPLRQHLRQAMRSQGITPEQERSWLVQRHGLRRHHAVATAGMRVDGRRIEGRLAMAVAMARAYWRSRRGIVRRPWGLGQTALLLYRQAFTPLGLDAPA